MISFELIGMAFLLWLSILHPTVGDLQSKDYQPEKGGFDKLWRASCEGNKQEVQKLLKYNSVSARQGFDGETALSVASRLGHEQVVDVLLNSNSSEAHLLATDNGGKTPLMKASLAGHIQVMKRLLKYHRDRQLLASDADGLTPLMWATKARSTEAAEVLLNYIPERQLQKKSKRDLTALVMACESGHSNMVAMLLNYLPEKQLKPDGRFDYTALEYAGKKDRYEFIVELLMQKYRSLNPTGEQLQDLQQKFELFCQH